MGKPCSVAVPFSPGFFGWFCFLFFMAVFLLSNCIMVLCVHFSNEYLLKEQYFAISVCIKLPVFISWKIVNLGSLQDQSIWISYNHYKKTTGGAAFEILGATADVSQHYNFG